MTELMVITKIAGEKFPEKEKTINANVPIIEKQHLCLLTAKKEGVLGLDV